MVRYLSSREGRHPFWKEDEGKTMAAVSYHGHSATKAFNKYKLYVILKNQARNELITNKVHRLLHLCYTAEA